MSVSASEKCYPFNKISPKLSLAPLIEGAREGAYLRQVNFTDALLSKNFKGSYSASPEPQAGFKGTVSRQEGNRGERREGLRGGEGREKVERGKGKGGSWRE